MTVTKINLQTKEKTIEEWDSKELAAHKGAVKKDKKQNEKNRILNELHLLDLKSIRAIREGNSERIKALEAQAEQLRQKLR